MSLIAFVCMDFNNCQIESFCHFFDHKISLKTDTPKIDKEFNDTIRFPDMMTLVSGHWSLAKNRHIVYYMSECEMNTNTTSIACELCLLRAAPNRQKMISISIHPIGRKLMKNHHQHAKNVSLGNLLQAREEDLSIPILHCRSKLPTQKQ